MEELILNNLIDWVIQNWIEILGFIFGTGYLFFSIKQHILTWPLGLLTSVMYVYVFLVSKFYADMALQIYYVWISIYGWILWAKSKTTVGGKQELKVVRISKKQILWLSLIVVVTYILIYYVLKNYTDSPVPLGDSFTTALSIVATWMLARKIIEHWLIWIVVDAVSIGLYLYKGLFPTTILFLFYTVAAIWGYYEWKKELVIRNG